MTDLGWHLILTVSLMISLGFSIWGSMELEEGT